MQAPCGEPPKGEPPTATLATLPSLRTMIVASAIPSLIAGTLADPRHQGAQRARHVAAARRVGQVGGGRRRSRGDRLLLAGRPGALAVRPTAERLIEHVVDGVSTAALLVALLRVLLVARLRRGGRCGRLRRLVRLLGLRRRARSTVGPSRRAVPSHSGRRRLALGRGGLVGLRLFAARLGRSHLVTLDVGRRLDRRARLLEGRGGLRRLGRLRGSRRGALLRRRRRRGGRNGLTGRLHRLVAHHVEDRAGGNRSANPDANPHATTATGRGGHLRRGHGRRGLGLVGLRGLRLRLGLLRRLVGLRGGRLRFLRVGRARLRLVFGRGRRDRSGQRAQVELSVVRVPVPVGSRRDGRRPDQGREGGETLVLRGLLLRRGGGLFLLLRLGLVAHFRPLGRRSRKSARTAGCGSTSHSRGAPAR